MAHKENDDIDFNKLEKQLYDAVEEDAKYSRENDAKFRAIHQKVATYDDFRDIVLASHLKPLDKGEKIDGGFGTKQPWNTQASKQADSGTGKQNGSLNLKASGKLPKNGLEFARDWKRSCKTSADKYSMLLTIGGDKIGSVFKTEISFGLLGDIIGALNLEFKNEDTAEILNIMQNISTANRFSLSLQFLSTQEKDTCEKLFDKIKINGENLSEETINCVMQNYEIGLNDS